MRAVRIALTSAAFVSIMIALILASALLSAAVYTQLSGQAMPMVIAQS
jgi:hypothetical protein